MLREIDRSRKNQWSFPERTNIPAFPGIEKNEILFAKAA